MQGFRLYEVARNYTIAPFYVAYFSVCANKQKWQSLPKDVRDAIMSVSGLAGAKFWGKNFFDTAEEGVIERAKAGNYELNRYQVPPEQLSRSGTNGSRRWKARATRTLATSSTRRSIRSRTSVVVGPLIRLSSFRGAAKRGERYCSGPGMTAAR